MTAKTVLVSGAGIAGPSAAHWLHRGGYQVTVVESAPGLRPGGQAVDFRGEQVKLLAAMGVLDEIRRYETAMGDQTVLGLDGRPVLTVPGAAWSGEVEILRGDLARILYENTADHTEYVFGDRVTSLTETADGVEVTFRHGAPRTFDLVVGADGVHSGVRAAAFGPEPDFRTDLGFGIAGYTVPNHLGLDHTSIMYNEPGRGLMVGSHRLPDRLHVGLVFAADGVEFHRRTAVEQSRLITQLFADTGWETPKLLEALPAADDLYVDSISQIHLDRWSKGRVVLLGDAAWCAGPGGSGTGLAMMGAQVLAGELAAAGGDHVTAFAKYEQRLRKPATVGQKNGKGAGNFLAPRTAAKIRSRNRAYRMLSTRLLGGIFLKMTDRAANALEYREYPALTAAWFRSSGDPAGGRA
ncbi:FAD-dependent oxidoreductase [Amycolatopsis mediterranei S699]|uniref:FAD-dependent oxidoreductase n=2 Tax=Amycolatopsis mediterranei TaxID=33910 RepID=A0A0H3DH78_AMYMU|nr:FAD-dependent monooxygenase [Amycolatopsis mediterranei]ADJ49547.1 FAD-dependent oxidoreductase [Amycolatopsis mediterranei U32]AEK46526.1 FAD-dependent oxidoreductase [Amycolatopsis mediterranei S699]AFO81256.1 FAD-dependent oxidoreductase [Amycolatopsis mediterranei S699]AGT88384.1 FAD-dependent oxidoreductase [Amycolatopsis mediterranei RB]KDO04944.1 FAD-dependent oxidoreductase [Amycolatopsis mediterranei]